MNAEDISKTYEFSIVVQRWAATWVDYIFFAGTLAALFGIAGGHFEAVAGIWLILLLLYYPLLEGLAGVTVGKLMFGLRVVNRQRERPGVLKAIIRTLVRLIEVNPLWAGGLPAGIVVACSKTRQRLGDMAAGTYVLRASDLARAPASPALRSVPYQLPQEDFIISGAADQPSLATNLYHSATAPESSDSARSLLLTRRPILFCASAMTIAAVGLVALGAIGISQSNTSQRPITIDCAEFLKSPPKDGWYHIKNCNYDLSEAAFEVYRFKSKYEISDIGHSATEHVTDVYVPLYRTNHKDGEKTSLLMHSTNSKIKDLVSELNKLEDADENSVKKWVEAHLSEMVKERDIEGMVTTESHFTDTAKIEIEQIQKEHLTSAFKTVNEGDYPMPMSSYSAVGGGIVIGLLAIGIWIAAAASAQWFNQPS